MRHMSTIMGVVTIYKKNAYTRGVLMKNWIKSKRSRGFTLLELIVVITIIGILGTLVVVKVTGFVGKAKDLKIKTDLKAIVQAATYYQLETGSYPEDLEQLKSGVADDGSKTTKVDKAVDPWGNEYEYELVNGEPTARCLGKDGTEGGEGEDTDYTYPEQDSYDDY